MMKKQNSREIGGEPIAKIKSPGIGEQKKLRCLRDSDFPGVGFFVAGQIVDDQRTVAVIADNPNFEAVKEEQP